MLLGSSLSWVALTWPSCKADLKSWTPCLWACAIRHASKQHLGPPPKRFKKTKDTDTVSKGVYDETQQFKTLLWEIAQTARSLLWRCSGEKWWKMHIVLHWHKLSSGAFPSTSLAMFSEYSRRVSVKQCRHKTFVQLPLSLVLYNTIYLNLSIDLCANPTIFHTQQCTWQVTNVKHCCSMPMRVKSAQVLPVLLPWQVQCKLKMRQTVTRIRNAYKMILLCLRISIYTTQTSNKVKVC